MQLLTGLLRLTAATLLLLLLVVVAGCLGADVCPSAACDCVPHGNALALRCTEQQGVFPHFAPTNISFGRLQIIRQHLSQVPAGGLRNVPVRSLDLSRNLFRRGLDAGAFVGQESTLKELSLRDCRLPSVPIAALSKLSSLGMLRLDGNMISVVEKQSFELLSNLKELHLYRNQITKLHPAAFVGLSNLEHLKLFENQLKRLPRKLLQHVPSLLSLDISANRLTQILPRTFEGLKSLKWLVMEANSVHSLNRKVFRGLSSLRYLKMEGNPLQRVAGGCFRPVRHLNYLSLDIGQVKPLHNDTFSGLHKLKTLNVGEVNRTQIPSGLLTSVLNLQYFSLSDYNGQLDSIDAEVFDSDLSFERLNLFLTPIRHCRCDVAWITDLSSRGAYVQGYCARQRPISCVKRRKDRRENERKKRRKRKKHSATSRRT